MIPTNSERDTSRIAGWRSEATPDFSLCLRTICCNSYFDRVWVIQEFLLARASEFWWGGDMFPTVGLQRAVQQTQKNLRPAPPTRLRHRSKPEPMSLTTEMLERVSRFTRFAVQFNSGGERPRLIDAILSIKPSLCSDKRDRVYALLSLASDGSQFAIDYKERLYDLYIRLCRFYSFSRADTEPAVSLAALLDVNGALLIKGMFVELPTNFGLSGHNRSRSAEVSQPSGAASPKITYRVWMLHSLDQCRGHWRIEMGISSAVRRVDREPYIQGPRFDGPDQRSLGGNALCTICARRLSSKSPGPQKLTRFGSSHIWLNFSMYPDCTRPSQRIVGLNLADLDPSKRGTPQESIRVALEGIPLARHNLHWLLIDCGEDGSAFPQSTISVDLHSFCSSHTCPLSRDVWEKSPQGIPYEDDGSVGSLFEDL